MFEGTGLYFWLLFLIVFIVYITVKVCLAYLFKRAKEKSWKAYVPFYNKLVLVDMLEMNRKTFYFTLIPVVNLYYYYLIIKELLKAFGARVDDAIWFLIIPMYKFPEFVFKRPKFLLNEYDLTSEFLSTQQALTAKPKTEEVEELELNNNVSNGFDINNINGSIDNNDSVFTNESLEPDTQKLTYVEAKNEEVKEEKPIISPLDTGRPKVCPNCGATLAPSATVCFMCGTQIGG